MHNWIENSSVELIFLDYYFYILSEDEFHQNQSAVTNGR